MRFGFLICLGLISTAAQAGDRVLAPDGQVSIEKPAGWHLLAPDAALANLRSINPDSPEYQALVSKVPQAPLITIMKELPERARGAIPTVKVSYRVLPGAQRHGAKKIAELVLESFQNALPDVQLLKPLTETELGGRPAVYGAVRFRLVKGDPKSETESAFWVVTGGNYFYSVGSSHPSTSTAEDRVSLEAAVRSIRFAP